MSDPTTTLATWRAVTEGATRGPWRARVHGYEIGIEGPVEDEQLIVVTYPVNPEDAAFIATTRTAMPRLIAFAEAVLALHRPVEVEPSDTICSECSTRLPNGRYLPTVEWPCPTAALAERLGGEGL